MKKSIVTLLLSFVFASAVHSQTSSFFQSIRPELDQVIKDFPNHFSYIKGNVLMEEANDITYESKVQVKGAVETKVITSLNQKYRNNVWECRLFETDNLQELQKKYKQLYNDISNKSITARRTNYTLQADGPYSNPTEELRLWSNQFRCVTTDERFHLLVVDLVAEYINFQWTVYVRVYDKPKDDEIGPTEKK